MLPTEHLKAIYLDFMAKLLNASGFSYLDKPWRHDIRTSIYMFVICLGVIGEINTIVTYDRETVLKCSTTSALACQGLHKMTVFLSNMPAMRELVDFIERVALQCDKTLFEAVILVRWGTLTKKVMTVFVSLITITALSFTLLPPYLYFVNGIKECLLPIYLPYFDANTLSGFIVQTIFQMCLLLACALGVLCVELSIFIFIMQICSLTDIIMYKMNLLCEELQYDDTLKDRPQTRLYLRNIARMHYELIEYTSNLSDVFQTVFFSEIMFDMISMCIILFVSMQIDWFPLNLFMLSFFTKTFAMCLLGTITDVYVSLKSPKVINTI